MLPLEDSYLDIIGKSQRGLSLTDEQLSQKAGITPLQWKASLEGEINEPVLRKIAGALNLGADALLALANKKWSPAPISLTGLQTFTTQFEDMTVNAYLVWDLQSKEAIAFDTGADITGMIDFAKSNGLSIKLILITHTHADHILDLNRLKEKTGAPAYLGDREPSLAGATPFAAGKEFKVGALSIQTRLTWGHAEGGITYVIRGLTTPLAIVGDAIFAGSMGGGKVSWKDALSTARSEILTLPDQTILASGHGPLTTVAETKAHNPFFSR
jgi:hydroxyacylglutathione hydrolase